MLATFTVVALFRPPAPETVYRPYRISINRADTLDLALLPGVGEGLARRILRSRQLYGPFETPADLERVPGVGPTVRRRLARYAAGTE